MRTLARACTGLLAAVLLNACVSTPTQGPLPDLDDWETRQRVLGSLRDWGFSGRIAVSDAHDGFNGNLHWEQRRDYFDVRLSGPLGAGTVLIAGDAGRIRVTDSDGVVTHLHDPAADLRRLYGWQIPIQNLRYWALGIPAPGQVAETALGDDALMDTLSQAGWDVTISQYRDGGGQAMPRKLTATRGDTRVRLVIDRWHLRQGTHAE